MPGHMGDKQITVRNLRIRGIDLEENLLMVEGAVPGSARRVCADLEGEDSAARAPWLCRIRYGGSVEGFEEGQRQAQVGLAVQAYAPYGAQD